MFHIARRPSRSRTSFDRCNRLLTSPLELLPLYDWIQQVKRLHYEGCSLPVVPLIESRSRWIGRRSPNISAA